MKINKSDLNGFDPDQANCAIVESSDGKTYRIVEKEHAANYKLVEIVDDEKDSAKPVAKVEVKSEGK